MTGVHELESKLQKAEDWPTPIHGWRVERGTDALGQDAVWVWVTLSDPLPNWTVRSHMRRMVREAVAKITESDPSWVYVRFRDESEENEA